MAARKGIKVTKEQPSGWYHQEGKSTDDIAADRLCALLEANLRHEDRRHDMMIAWQNARDRIEQ